jgi:ketosteroid isomerase-like protein
MTDSSTVTSWIDGYLRAWDSNAPDDIRALFTEDAEYRTAPFDDARAGQDAIVAGWIEDQDRPGDHTFTWKLAGLDGDTAFVEGLTTYSEGRVYANLWVIRFATDGRAVSYTEWYMRIPEESSPHPNA